MKHLSRRGTMMALLFLVTSASRALAGNVDVIGDYTITQSPDPAGSGSTGSTVTVPGYYYATTNDRSAVIGIFNYTNGVRGAAAAAPQAFSCRKGNGDFEVSFGGLTPGTYIVIGEMKNAAGVTVASFQDIYTVLPN